MSAGNIGRPLCEVLPQTRKLDAVVLEVSSFQLETIDPFERVWRAVEFGGGPFGSSWVDGKLCSRQGASLRKSKTFDWAIIQLRHGNKCRHWREGAGEGRHLQRSQHSADVYVETIGHQSIARSGRFCWIWPNAS